MGYAIAQAAWRRGADVTLVSGPSSLDPPFGVDLIRVETAQEMHEAVSARIGSTEVNVFSAAVADFRPADARESKLKRSDAGDTMTLDLTQNPDVANDTRSARKSGSVNIGFALETDDVLVHAAGKLERKGFDLLVANDATEEGAGFGVSTNRVTVLLPDGSNEELPLMSKDEVADEMLDRVRPLLHGGQV
jgi:phosphopantothenoylcysteine decarboxylase/phosphopantothenate--cysteine ligase